MVSIEQRINLLRRCESRPRVLMDFTQGDVHETVWAKHVEGWLNELVSEGLLARFADSFATTAAGRQELAELTVPPSMACSRAYCNASIRQAYVPPVWQIRAGADSHRQFASAGIGC